MPVKITFQCVHLTDCCSIDTHTKKITWKKTAQVWYNMDAAMAEIMAWNSQINCFKYIILKREVPTRDELALYENDKYHQFPAI